MALFLAQATVATAILHAVEEHAGLPRLHLAHDNRGRHRIPQHLQKRLIVLRTT
jgi:hypothetical protein